MTKADTVLRLTREYLDGIDVAAPPAPNEIEAALLERLREEFTLHNSAAAKGDSWAMPDHLFNAQIAEIILRLYSVRRVAAAGLSQDADYDVLAIYCTEGEDAGVYVSDMSMIARIIYSYNRLIAAKGIEDIIKDITAHAPRVERTSGLDLVPMNNGVFDYGTKTLTPYSPDFVFLSKSHVDYVPNAVNPVIKHKDGTVWDVESWMGELTDDPEVEQLLWEIIGASLRPNVPWGKAAWFFSERGNNGKGTLCALMRNILGQQAYASIPLGDFGKDFLLEPLVKAQAIIVDENDVGLYIDKSANLKAVVTGDVISINRKFKAPIAYCYKGIMVQCLNEMPRVKDRSDSFYRRQLFVPFTKCFTGRERKYIKQDYLARKDVLEYVAYKVLNMDYYEFSEPAACREALNEYKAYNDPVRQFADEVVGDLVWDLVPYAYLYDLYRAWFKKNSPSGQALGRTSFVHDISLLFAENPDWYPMSRTDSPKYATKLMDKPEKMSLIYGLDDWLNPHYKGGDTNKLCTPDLSGRHRGLIRIGNTIGTGDAN